MLKLHFSVHSDFGITIVLDCYFYGIDDICALVVGEYSLWRELAAARNPAHGAFVFLASAVALVGIYFHFLSCLYVLQLCRGYIGS